MPPRRSDRDLGQLPRAVSDPESKCPARAPKTNPLHSLLSSPLLCDALLPPLQHSRRRHAMSHYAESCRAARARTRHVTLQAVVVDADEKPATPEVLSPMAHSLYLANELPLVGLQFLVADSECP